MKDVNDGAFRKLFAEACTRCYGFLPGAPLSETDCKVLSNKILEATGLVIGPKSLKNYSNYVLGSGNARKENPSAATLDTLARYVLGAPYTDESTRRTREDHNPYWFDYRARYSTELPHSTRPKRVARRKASTLARLSAVALVLAAAAWLWWPKGAPQFREDFATLAADSLRQRGWLLKDPAATWWAMRDSVPGFLTLYTLAGDNWPDASHPARIPNLLMRKLDAECFSVELHLADFFPQQNWQQAGLLLSEDSTYTSKAIRLSVSYNDFFGGYNKSPEIIIQALSSSETGALSKPEEFTHFTLFNIGEGEDSLVRQNLSHLALKIERRGSRFRFLYSTGSRESFAFKEVASGQFHIAPRYLGLFAIQGHADQLPPLPVKVDAVSVLPLRCQP